jgi:hypothetical protein
LTDFADFEISNLRLLNAGLGSTPLPAP